MSILAQYNLPEDIRKEFRVDSDGKVFAKSIIAISRLAGCRDSSVHGILDNLALCKPVSDPLKPFTGIDYKALGEFPDLLVAAIVKHFAWYAQKTNQVAKDNDLIFSAVGFRTLFQQQLGWKRLEPSAKPNNNFQVFRLSTSKSTILFSCLLILRNHSQSANGNKKSTQNGQAVFLALWVGIKYLG